jgi:hypothetical protein
MYFIVYRETVFNMSLKTSGDSRAERTTETTGTKEEGPDRV